ncbi:hypothetical protein KFE25_007236 [Diacronema lutheri]|uniref:Bidirectional sugar transporter SWEET n=1 Tax=Diacronema lutheri TaxID=2081491 RepID=A0A8J5XA52_DIALT|nr:hypothetical protein KFE25_007236 [Diacronema lutheri]
MPEWGAALPNAAPMLGLMLSQLLFLAPRDDVRAASLRGSLGALNPWPYALLVLNCSGYIVYGIDIADPYVCATNLPGVLLGLWYTMRLAPLISSKAERAKVETVALGSLGAWGCIGLARALALPDAAWPTMAFAWGTVGGMLLFFGSPLASLATVLERADASAIHPTLAALSLCNCVSWTAYGALGLRDPFIALPNAAGATLAIVQLGLRAYFAPPPGAGAGAGGGDGAHTGCGDGGGGGDGGALLEKGRGVVTGSASTATVASSSCATSSIHSNVAHLPRSDAGRARRAAEPRARRGWRAWGWSSAAAPATVPEAVGGAPGPPRTATELL